VEGLVGECLRLNHAFQSGRLGRDPPANGEEPELIVALRRGQEEVVGHVAPALSCFCGQDADIAECRVTSLIFIKLTRLAR